MNVVAQGFLKIDMNVILLLVVSVVTYVVLMYIGVRFFIQEETPPKSVRFTGITETVFGTLTSGLGLFIYDPKAKLLGMFLMLFGLFWVGVAVSLYKGSKIGRVICLIVSIIRIPTVIGAFFSLVSIYKLYFTQESKDFFNKVSAAKDNPQASTIIH